MKKLLPVKFSATALVIVLLLALKLVDIASHPLRIGPTAAVDLQAAALILQGKQIYVDFFVPDQPFAIFCACIPTAISELLAQNVCFIQSLIIWMASCLSSALMYLILEPTGRSSKRYARDVIVVVTAAMCLIAGPEFGSHDYLFTIFFLPYLFARAFHAIGLRVHTALSVATGIAAGLALCNNLSFLIFLVTAESFLFISRRRSKTILDPSLLALLGTSIVAVTVAGLVAKAGLGNYLYLVDPLVHDLTKLSEPSQKYLCAAPERLDVFYSLVILIVLGAVVMRMRLIFMQLTIFALTGLALFAYTGSGLSEQLFPTIAAGSIMACMVVDSPRERLMRRFFKNGISAQFVWALSLAAILCAYFLTYDTRFHLHFAQTGKTRYDDRAPFAEEIERLAKPGDRVMFLTDGIRPAYPLSLQLGLRPASKWLYAFPLRLAYSEDPYDIDFTRIGLSGDEPAADKLEYLDMEKRLQNFFQNEEEELDRNSPRLVVVQTGSPEIALRKHHIMAVLEEKYYVAATLDWSTFKEHTTRQKLDLLGDLSPMRVYVLK